MSEDCYVYVIAQECKNPREDLIYVKIGISSNPWARVKQLQTGFPVKLVLYKHIKFVSRWQALQIEQWFHKTYADCAGEGEWVRICPADAIRELESASIHMWWPAVFDLVSLARACDKAGVSSESLMLAVQSRLDDEADPGTPKWLVYAEVDP